jgi:hypothetical protein
MKRALNSPLLIILAAGSMDLIAFLIHKVRESHKRYSCFGQQRLTGEIKLRVKTRDVFSTLAPLFGKKPREAARFARFLVAPGYWPAGKPGPGGGAFIEDTKPLANYLLALCGSSNAIDSIDVVERYYPLHPIHTHIHHPGKEMLQATERNVARSEEMLSLTTEEDQDFEFHSESLNINQKHIKLFKDQAKNSEKLENKYFTNMLYCGLSFGRAIESLIEVARTQSGRTLIENSVQISVFRNYTGAKIGIDSRQGDMLYSSDYVTREIANKKYDTDTPHFISKSFSIFTDINEPDSKTACTITDRTICALGELIGPPEEGEISNLDIHPGYGT